MKPKDRLPQRTVGGLGRGAIGFSPIGTFTPKPADREATLNNRKNEGSLK